MKQRLVHNNSVAQQESKKLIVEIAATFGFHCRSSEIPKTYLQILKAL